MSFLLSQISQLTPKKFQNFKRSRIEQFIKNKFIFHCILIFKIFILSELAVYISTIDAAKYAERKDVEKCSLVMDIGKQHTQYACSLDPPRMIHYQIFVQIGIVSIQPVYLRLKLYICSSNDKQDSSICCKCEQTIFGEIMNVFLG